MDKKKIITIVLIVLGLFLVLFLVFSTRKKTDTSSLSPEQNTANNQTAELVLSESEKPVISLTPRSDGHELKLKISNIPSNITQIDYELIYSATDNGLTMEKGVGDTLKITTGSIEKDLLLGTASCTNGCKYKYDEGVDSGTLSLYLYTDDNQSTVFETPFILITSSDIKKDGGFELTTQDFSVSATTTTNDYFTVIKNYPAYYSVFSSGTGKGKVTSITPDTITKDDMTSLVGDYQTQ